MNFSEKEVDLEYQRFLRFFIPQAYYSSPTMQKEEARSGIKYVQDLSDVIHRNYSSSSSDTLVMQLCGAFMAPSATEKLYIKVRSKSSK